MLVKHLAAMARGDGAGGRQAGNGKEELQRRRFPALRGRFDADRCRDLRGDAMHQQLDVRRFQNNQLAGRVQPDHPGNVLIKRADPLKVFGINEEAGAGWTWHGVSLGGRVQKSGGNLNVVWLDLISPSFGLILSYVVIPAANLIISIHIEKLEFGET